jgi:hypothetical protein
MMTNEVEVMDSNVENAIEVVEEAVVVEDPIEDLDGSDGSEPLEIDEDVAKAEELMRLIADYEVLKSYRKARHAGERRPITKEERKKKKAKRRQAKKSRR